MVLEIKWELEYLRLAVRKLFILFIVLLSVSIYIFLNVFLYFEFGILRRGKLILVGCRF